MKENHTHSMHAIPPPYAPSQLLPQMVPVLQSKTKATDLGFIQDKLQVRVYISFACREIEGKEMQDMKI